MKLVDHKELARAANMNRIGGEGAAKVLMMLLRLNKLNKIYSKLPQSNPIEFIDAAFKELGIKYDLCDEDIKRIPLNGPFITVSNHPYGGIDGVLLIKIISGLRPDYKILANFLLKRIEPLKDSFLAVNPFETEVKRVSSLRGIKEAINHLNTGHPLGLFPAGEVSTFNPDESGITDRQWQHSTLKFIKNAQVPIVPVYFQGSNSKFFHILGLIHPKLRTVKLPSELFNKKHKTFRIRIGNPISVKEQESFSDISRFGRFLRAKTYSLGTAIEVKRFFSQGLNRLKRIEEIISPVPNEKIIQEIEKISDEYHLFTSQNYAVFCVPSVEIPNVVTEIGRLREITFREIGEGTNRKIDIDEYDLYFNQLFIWDLDENKIVGAYRVGKGNDIIKQYGLSGFYIQSLFRINRSFIPVLKESIELGRSFIVKDYQRKPLPLFLLWKGILYFLIKHPEYRYLIGPVSISNRFSKFSKGIIIDFIKANYYNHEFAKHIKPRKKFRFHPTNVDKEILMENASNDLNKLDKTIKDIEPENIPIPVLLKKYLKLNGKIFGFNIDPKFNNALDGLLILDLYDVPMETITSLSKEINDDSILERFFKSDYNYLKSMVNNGE